MQIKHVQDDETYGSFIASDSVSRKETHSNGPILEGDNKVRAVPKFERLIILIWPKILYGNNKNC
jgi:hypothetical protein